MRIVPPRRSHGFRDPCVEGRGLMNRPLGRPLIGVLLAAAFPVASPAMAQEAQSQSGPTLAANDQEPTPSPPPALGPSITGPLHYNSNPLHVDGGPLGPVYISGVISGLGVVQDHPFPGD